MGYLRSAREVAPHMIAAGWGRIINISGLAARQTGSIIGSMRNVAVAALTKNLADELGPKGINVTVVHPGLTRTEKTAPLVAARAAAAGVARGRDRDADGAANITIGRIVDAAEVADIVAFLASPRSVAINGDAIACGGGREGRDPLLIETRPVLGKTVVITGATSGIGRFAAEALARGGARVVFVARDSARAEALLRQLVGANPDAAHDWVLADLTTIAAMRRAGEALAAKAARIDVLINNAGAIFDRREVTVDGLEKTFAVNHMAYFVLTGVLRSSLATDARIVSTASAGHKLSGLDFDDLQYSRRYSATIAYARSKLCNVLWTRELARRLEGSGITANCLHPGMVDTGLGDNTQGVLGAVFRLGKPIFRPFALTVAQGAETLIHLAASPRVAGQTGGYWAHGQLAQPSAAARDPAAALRLWQISARLAGVPA